MVALNRMPETRGTCQHCDVRYRRPADDPTPADRCQRCHEEITAMIKQGGDPTAGPSTTACDDQWRQSLTDAMARNRARLAFPPNCPGCGVPEGFLHHQDCPSRDPASDDQWREDRMDPIGQNGNDGLHYAEPAITAAEILRAGLGHMEDRAATYEKPQGERSMGKASAMFQTLYAEQLAAGEFSEEMGWAFMVLLKLVRTSQGGFRADNYEDGAAYFGLQGEAAARERGEVPA